MSTGSSKEIQQREFREFYDRFHTKLVRYADSYLLDIAASEDVVQEVFVFLWENAGELDVKLSLKSYIYTAVKNRCLNYLKSVDITDNLGFADFYFTVASHYNPEDVVEDENEKPEMLPAILKITETFPPQMQQIFRLWLCEGCKKTEIAEKLNLHANTVYTQLKRARQKICQEFARKSQHKNL
ncbi:sigma-70 family RNA polymerase sigma factor [Sinomicrobium pectinilyticum]|uniref:Sigma-70 family RNA polymerase sigma factor n=1 Tax=Sinomicrobium pectinilyticum TaxID=1084421 RepID=A0A3N0ERZ7_SINP1|nr:sigma-70 family RNA polymerase sigma factor [Sinomicrobium pectinilyticum]RNL90670.1 sigma-70 family RNA polymerase sigma factor [Sinomicrobium pectinilyticum]